MIKLRIPPRCVDHTRQMQMYVAVAPGPGDVVYATDCVKGGQGTSIRSAAQTREHN
eukprot:COSAG05_NODE_2030_length_3669_cov_4.825637_4_plen_55_part_01